MVLLQVTLNDQSVCFVDKRESSLKAQETDELNSFGAFRYNYEDGAGERHQPKDRSRGAEGEAGCL